MKKFAQCFIAVFLLLAASNSLAEKTLSEKISLIETANRAWNNIQAKFTQKTEIKILDKTVAKKGTLTLKKGGKLKIAYEGKEEKTYVSDGSTIWIFIPNEKDSLQTYPANDKNIPREALTFLGDFGSLAKIYKVTESKEFKPSEKEIALRLEPKKQNPHYSALDTLFDEKGLLKELVVWNSSGNVSRYTLSNVKMDTTIDDSFFTLNL